MVSSASYVGGVEVRNYYSFTAALRRATDETIDIIKVIVERLGQLMTGEASAEKSVGGPVKMVQLAK